MPLVGPFPTTCIIFASLLLHDSCNAYSLPPRRPKSDSRSNFGCGSGGGNNGSPPRPFDFRGDDSYGDESTSVAGVLFLSTTDSAESPEQVRYGLANETSSDHITLRGGGAVKKQSDNIISAIKKMLPFIKSKDTESGAKQQEEILTSTIVTEVTAPTSNLLPPEVLTLSAEHAKLIGGRLTPETLEMTAKSINDWYASQGYVMNSVNGATLVPSQNGQGRVELKVREAKMSRLKDQSVVIRFVEPCGDESDERDEILNLPLQSESSDETQQYQQYRIASGRTRPSKLAKIVGLTPGSHFRIIPQRWSRIVASSGGIFGGQSNVGGSNPIFSTVHALRPIPEDDGSVTVEIIATENKPFASVEYGVTKSLYSDQWEGELDLNHANAFGGGEVATLSVKKGRGSSSQGITDGPTSWRMSISDDSLSDTGYSVEIFRDNVGTSEDKKSGTRSIGRTGATMQFRMPRTVSPRAISASFEQIEPTDNSVAAPMQTASVTMNLGPLNFLYSGLSAVLTSGVQRDATNKQSKSTSKPYFMGTLTSQKIVPMCLTPFASGDQSKSYVNLAMRHVATVSTKYLPRHEAIMLGLSSRVRGYSYSKKSYTQKGWGSCLRLNKNNEVCPHVAVANSVCGNIELRMPFKPVFNDANPNLNALSSMLEGNIVAFGDWAFSHAQFDSKHDSQAKPERLFRSSSVGIGYRKVAQGLPLKVDAVITEHGTGGIFFGIGRDF